MKNKHGYLSLSTEIIVPEKLFIHTSGMIK